MQLATSSTPTDPNLLAQLFPAAAPTANHPPAVAVKANDGGEFDRLFPDLAPARATTGAPCHASLENPSETAGAPGELGKPSADRDENPVERAPRASRSKSCATRSIRRGAVHRPAAAADSPSAGGNSVPVVADVPVIPCPDELPVPAGDVAEENEALFPQIDGLPTPPSELRTMQTTPPGLARLMALRDVTVPGGEPDNAMPPGAATDTPDGFMPTDGVDVPALAPADSTGTGEIFTRPLGFFTTPASLTNTLSLSDAAGPNTADAAATLAMEVANQPALVPETAGANFAVVGGKSLSIETISSDAMKKSFVSADGDSVTSRRKSLGIDGAKSGQTMFTRFLSDPLQHPASEYAAAAVGSAGGVLDMVSPAPETLVPETIRTARGAVDVVLQAAEHLSLREQKSVSLQFSVGGADLSVRVELHANEVRATFRTNSPELRDALSREWQALVSTPANGDRPFRVAPAVFTGSDQSAPNAFSGEASSRQRDQQAQRSAHESPMGRAHSAGSVAAPIASPSSGGPLAASLTSRHLYTLA